VLNDLVDAPQDRNHPNKKNRQREPIVQLAIVELGSELISRSSDANLKRVLWPVSIVYDEYTKYPFHLKVQNVTSCDDH
jgi:hypothetical protein